MTPDKFNFWALAICDYELILKGGQIYPGALDVTFISVITFPSFAGFWYPANKICISLVYIIGTNIETQEKKCRTSIYMTESRHIH